MSEPTEPVRVLIVDDHALFRESLARLLDSESDLEVVGQTASVDEALSLAGKTQADVVLLDMDLGLERGGAFVERSIAMGFKARVLIVTAGVGEEEAAQLLAAGASGIVLKHSAPSVLTASIRRVLAGEACIDQSSLRAILRQQAARRDWRRQPALTEREREVLRGVFDGLANKEIGARLGISESSVKAALQQLFQKTGVRTRSQLVRVALERFKEDLHQTE